MKPNVIFILCDQLRKDWLGCYGHPSVQTPHLDALAERGVRCEHNIVTNPICMPSRMGMLTGLHAHNHGLWTNGILVDPMPLTVAEHARQHGVRTGSFGKIHISPTGNNPGSWEAKKRWREIVDAGGQAYDDTGPYAGFEHVELTIGHGGAMSAHYEQWFRERGGTDEMLMPERDPDVHHTSGVRDLPVELHHSTFVAERSSAWLRERAAQQEQFFAHISFPDPHHPFDPPRSCAEAVDASREPAAIAPRDGLATRPPHYARQLDGQWSRRGLKEQPAHPGGVSDAETQLLRARTTAMMNLVDSSIGTIIETLRETGLLDNTIIVFSSDHGDGLGDHGIWGKGPWAYRSIIETPLLIAGPGIAQGVSEQVISDVDLAPTMTALLGLPAMPFVDGLDVSSHCRDLAQSTRSAALIEYRNGSWPNDYASAGLVGPDWTYVRYQDGAEELTDLRDDPDEHLNRAASEPERCQALRSQLLDYLLASQTKGPAQLSHA